MKPGRKPKAPEAKIAAGTYQPCRDDKKSAAISGTTPVIPGHLDSEAQAVWIEELPRVIRSGVSDLDSSFFARYCAIEAASRQLGGNITAAMSSELRRYAEQLGIAGPSSRLSRGADTSTQSPTNPFLALPR